MEPVSLTLGIGSILGNVFGSLFGANKQASSAERAARVQSQTALDLARMEREALDEQLRYLRQTDERDRADWLEREGRDRRDWEASEQRRAPFRALADSAVRTLADYIRVPGMHAAQEVPVQQWTHDPRSSADFDAHRAAGLASGQDMSWMNQQRPPVNTSMPIDPQMRAGVFVGPQPPQRRTLADFAR